MQLRHAVITSVDRDDLPDFGAYIFAETIRQIKQRLPDCSVEVLVPDFQGNEDSIRTVLEAGPDIYNHNTETVPRLYKRCRPGGRYERVMQIFRTAKRLAPHIPTKTGIILGMGETLEEVEIVMRDLRAVDVDILTLGQYLRPSETTFPSTATSRRRSSATCARSAWRWDSGTSSRARWCDRAITRGSRSSPPARAAESRSIRHPGRLFVIPSSSARGSAVPRCPTSKFHGQEEDRSSQSRPTPTCNRSLLHSMLLQRRFEERCAEAYALGKIGGFCHLYIGQEAVSTGSLSMLRPDDYIITTYRDHGQALARGMSPRVVMSELFGRIDGCARGKGGSMHMFDKSLNFLGGHGIVGAHVPLGDRGRRSRSSIAAAIRCASASWASRS